MDDIRPWIGSTTTSRLVKRPKGIRFRRYVWISRVREVLPIRGLSDSHLFFVARSLLKLANDARWHKITEIWNAQKKGKDTNGYPVSYANAMERTDKLRHATAEVLAQEEFTIYHDITDELKRRHIDPNSDKAAIKARKELETTIRHGYKI